MPWIALGWLTLYLQLLGFSDLAAAVLNALLALGCALGSYCGGLLGAARFMSTTPRFPLPTSCSKTPNKAHEHILRGQPFETFARG